MRVSVENNVLLSDEGSDLYVDEVIPLMGPDAKTTFAFGIHICEP